MSDPLSIAASVAGLLALTGTVSKSVFQFVTSIKDAPEHARTLVRSLYTLNVALGQIQQNILDPDFISETDDKDVEELQRCLAICTTLFTQLQKKVEDCELGLQGQYLLGKGWESVKWSFTDDILENLLRSLEAEKATLQLLISAFMAKVTTGLLRYAKQTEARTRHMSRQLKDITITLQWLLPKVPGQRAAPITSAEQKAVESSVFAASSAYNADELATLLRSSGSSLSLALDTSDDDTASVLWQPETERSLEPRASFSRALTGPPPQDQLGRLRNTDSLMSSTATSGMLQIQETRRSWLRNAPASVVDLPRMTTSIAVVYQMASVLDKLRSDTLIAGKASFQLASELQDIMTRVTSFSELLQIMFEADEEDPELLDAWKSTEDSVRAYYDVINHALDRARTLDRARKGAVIWTLFSARYDNERETLRQVAIRNIETMHMLTHTSYMKRTMVSQQHQRQQMVSQQHQRKQLDAIMGYMSTQFEMLRADFGHLTTPAPTALRSLKDWKPVLLERWRRIRE